MSVYKTLTPSDVTRIPFNANKLFTLNSSSATELGINFQKFEFSSASLDSYSSASVDTSSSIKYHQLDHLFYKNNKLDIANRLGDADYLNQPRVLYTKVNTISIPSNLFGTKIKPGTFQLTSSNYNIIDDEKGNLLISGTQLVSHSIDERERVFFLGPIKGFKKHDPKSRFYGEKDPNELSTHRFSSHPIKPVRDDSYYINNLEYTNILFTTQSSNLSGSSVNFVSNPNTNTGVTSSILAPHNELYNFNPEDNFTISMYINPKHYDGYVISKSTTKTLLKTPIDKRWPTNLTGSSQLKKIDSRAQYPFEIYLTRETNQQGTFNLINFRRSDGNKTTKISSSLTQDKVSHIVCMKSASIMSLYINGSQIKTATDETTRQTENQANLYIGSKGERSNYFSGSISNLMIFNQYKTDEQIKTLSSSLDSSPYVGNIFYSNGLATITSPNYQHIAKPHASNPFQMKFKSMNTIYENEFMCTVRSDEYNFTHNISTRKIQSDQHTYLANFATGSLWKPYVTTIGLYNEDGDLLIVGKLGQPIRMSDETDTTFVLRWDS